MPPRAASLLLVALSVAAGCATAGTGGSSPGGAAKAGAATAASTGGAGAPSGATPGGVTRTAVVAVGAGLLRDQTPPQRRHRIIGAGDRMRVVEESNVQALPGTERPVRIPDPEPAEPPPGPKDAPPVIEIPAPR